MTTPRSARAVSTPDGRILEVVTAGLDGAPGPLGNLVLVYHSGTPSAALLPDFLVDPALALGLPAVVWSRPGYGKSTPQPGRSVAAVAADTATVLDALGIGSFVTLGWSGGGPHALACAALRPDRCRAAAILAGVAPYGAPGLDWMAGMGPENVEEFGCSIAGIAQITAFLEAELPTMRSVEGPQVAASLGGLVPDVDKAAITGELAEYLAGALRNAVAHGIGGWRDDDLAFVKDWGFPLHAITRPVAVWQGSEDLMVPFAHGQWLAGAIPGAEAHLLPGEGHLSFVPRFPEILSDLARLGSGA